MPVVVYIVIVRKTAAPVKQLLQNHGVQPTLTEEIIYKCSLWMSISSP